MYFIYSYSRKQLVMVVYYYKQLFRISAFVGQLVNHIFFQVLMMIIIIICILFNFACLQQFVCMYANISITLIGHAMCPDLETYSETGTVVFIDVCREFWFCFCSQVLWVDLHMKYTQSKFVSLLVS